MDGQWTEMVGEYMKKNKGMTIVEVIISLVILVIISSMVLSVSKSYLVQFSTVRRDITAEGFGRRGNTEKTIEEIENLIAVRNEISDIVSSSEQQIKYIDLELKKPSLSAADKDKLNDEKSHLVALMGQKKKEEQNAKKNLEPYLDKKNSWTYVKLKLDSTEISKKEDPNVDFVYITSPNTITKHSITGWVFGTTSSQKIPILSDIVRYLHSDTTANREQQVADNVTGQTLYAKSEYVPGFENRDNLEQVAWYQSRPGYHIFPLDLNKLSLNDSEKEKLQKLLEGNEFYPVFPTDYNYISKKGVSGPGYTDKKIQIANTMENGFVVCGIRPYTKQGILGRLVGSTPIYISKLPFGKDDYLFREDISIINPNKLLKKYSPDTASNIKVKELYAWNNEEASSTQGQFSVPLGKEGVPYLLQPEQTGIIKENGTEFETKSRYLSFAGDTVGVVSPLREKQFNFFVVFGRGSTVNQEGNIISIPFLRDNVKATEITATGSGNEVRIDKVTVLAKIGFDKIQLIQPEQVLVSKTGKQCKVEEEMLATKDISNDMKKVEFGKKAGIFMVDKKKNNLSVELNGENLGNFNVSKWNLYDNMNSSVYFGSLAQIDDVKLSTEAAEKNEYKSAEVHVYEMVATKPKTSGGIKDQTDALKDKYGIE